MANCSRGRGRQVRAVPVQPQTAQSAGGILPEPPEPSVRRWPHPVDGVIPTQQIDPSLHYIRCALSYQNQLLADIKALLQQMAAKSDAPDA